jgi:hypothetical protein
MESQKEKVASKIYDFQLLKARPHYLRLDVLPIFFTVFLLYFNFGSKIFDRE